MSNIHPWKFLQWVHCLALMTIISPPTFNLCTIFIIHSYVGSVPVITTNHGLHLISSKELSQFKVNAQYLSSNILPNHRQPLPIHTRWTVILPNSHSIHHPITKPESQWANTPPVVSLCIQAGCNIYRSMNTYGYSHKVGLTIMLTP